MNNIKLEWNNKNIELFNYASFLYKILYSKGIIDRTKNVRQLGLIKVRRSISKSRFDYLCIQLYIHGLVRKNVTNELEFTYNSRIRKNPEITIMDYMQCLTILYNIGHYNNTFTSSRAMILHLSENKELINDLIDDDNLRKIICIEVESLEYHHLHLINAYIILSRLSNCDNLAIYQQILTNYLLYRLNETRIDGHEITEKEKYAFDIFAKIRNLAFICFDLQLNTTPLKLDYTDEKVLILFLKEYLNHYNNDISSISVIKCISKFLHDSLYNNDLKVIIYYEISKRMQNQLPKYIDKEIYYNIIVDEHSVLNNVYSQKTQYNVRHLTHINYEKKEENHFIKVLNKLQHIAGARVGYYNRENSDKTIVLSISRHLKNEIHRSFMIFKTLSSSLSSMRIDKFDQRHLIITKFFLQILFKGRQIKFISHLCSNNCIYSLRGKIKRVRELDIMIENCQKGEDTRHELSLIREVLEIDNNNDLTYIVACSTIVYDVINTSKTEVEFDGIIIFPNRKKNNIVFIEAKNGKKNGTKELKKKLNKLNILFEENNVITKKNDGIIFTTI